MTKNENAPTVTQKLSFIFRKDGLAGNSYDTQIINCYALGNVLGGEDNSWMVGGLVGKLWGGLIQESYAEGNVTGNAYCGGLVGDGYGIIYDCYATGDVTGVDNIYNYSFGGLMGGSGAIIEKSYATGSVQAEADVGGLVGETTTHSVIRDCYAKGTVTHKEDYTWSSGLGGLVGYNRGEIVNCYSTGAVYADEPHYDSIGGFVGQNTGTVYDSYWNTQTSGQTTSDGGVGRNTNEMTYPYADNTYVDWAFDDVWIADSNYMFNDGYPILYYQDVPLELNSPIVTIELIENNHVQLSWNPVESANSYKIYYSNVIDVPLDDWELLDSTVQTSYEHLIDVDSRMFYYVTASTD